MTEYNNRQNTIQYLKDSLERLENLIRSPYARQADVVARDGIARRLREALSDS